MSISQRIGKNTKAKLNELQAKIVLLKNQKLSITDLIDKIVLFSIQNKDEFVKFLSTEKHNENLNLQKEKFFEFLLSPLEGAGPEDFKEYEYDED